ncbi:lysophospholipid acyltransferase family protein [Actinoalloteichus hymeniacidonis]|uniref:1-acyl-sn-glycerol-3-phosphate acyltransferase n=1 Tax=Actinoalloteichus hymeniacidonis TaxID=340345 RepID=A0AAC9MYB0_9PSEU|nr:lysophospholipid acyltransferase family protein [Actinoalloteichus hymeniacidonis]AOS62777.1 1-acyl-sn-glycerol-3-phosphate acyltransferase [Actinoalloteichus hymeniacidonis]MBB5909192.1 1-acyl-sn-glycerol-3-phosphate acyltransferase [Actinoalloteichus hymeniacidonis]
MSAATPPASSSGTAEDDRSPLPEGASRWVNRIGRWIGTTIGLVFFRIRVRDRDRLPHGGPVVLVANHSSLIDGPLLFGLVRRPCVFLIKHEIFRGPLGRALRRMGQLPVRRGEVDRVPLLASIRVLRAGGLVAVFPEGTRGSGDVSGAHNGAAWLARSSDALVVPVACRGTRRPEGSGRRFRPRVDVLFGEAFTVPSGRGRAALHEATARVQGELAELVRELDRRLIAETGSPGMDEGEQT